MLQSSSSNVCSGVADKNPENTPPCENVEHTTDNPHFEDTYSAESCYADYDSSFDEIDDYFFEEREAYNKV
jgi:hypothetical protein